MQKLLLLALLLVLGAPTTTAQSQALSNALAHFQAQRSDLGLTEADLAEVAVTDEVLSAQTGVTHLYLRQTVNGVEVYNARANANVAADGRVIGAFSSFLANAAGRTAADTATPSLSAEAAVEAAARHLDLEVTGIPSVIEPADARGRMMLSKAGVSLEPIPAQLVYFATEDGALRLAWDLAIYQLDAEHWWSLRVDAQTGAVLDKTDWVVHDEWVSEDLEMPADYRPLAPSPADGARVSGSYNVWALPLESPNHGPRTLEVTPHDPETSPTGWHDDGNTTYTITRGNNVYAYEDRDANNQPGNAPDGGAGLVFDFPVDFDQQPITYQDAVITNLFYWNNVVHDVLARYGFDEAAGNFQQTNQTTAGVGNDPVQAEAQDGSGTNNANFSTPPDGLRPRMQMFEWGAPPRLAITAPAEIAGFYPNSQAAFGPDFPVDPDAVSIVPVISTDGGGDDAEGADRACDSIINIDEIEGNIALIERGDCGFFEKVLNAQGEGAIGVIVHNNSRTGAGETGTPEDLVTMGAGTNNPDDITIPATFIRQSDGLLFFENADGLEGFVELVGINRDSDLDAGVIAHEYGHGVSNRLTGGPSAVSCLNGDEQMGEGWSDYIGIVMTMREGDTQEQRRGVGTYLEFQETDGGGIRPFPYSTDMGINPTTYGTAQNYSVPHGVGSVWAQMLWEMTWNLIDGVGNAAGYGFDPDVYGGTGGNNIALNLVMNGMKMQPCSPGFVTGRDAILMADEEIYDGANAEAIWRAFAKRGLGWSAEQGSVASISDGVEAFDLPPFLTSNEDDAAALPNGYRLTAAYPNPFASASRFTLEVSEAQDVRVAVYDVVGREVARLHDGLLAAGSRHEFAVEGASLATGVYLVRVTGADFAETRRVTLLR